MYEVGSRLVYDDGRPGHHAKAIVLSNDGRVMVVQFEDRADTTAIRLTDGEWMQHIKPA